MLAANHVLWIVDDSPAAAGHVVEALRGLGTVELISDPLVVLERIAAGEVPDLMTLDWEMPGISGVDVCRQVRARLSDAEVPVLMVTGNDAPDAVVEGLEAGANDFVRKPFSPAELRARVKGLLRFHDAAVRERRLMSMVSHDLRNPLAVIMMSVLRIEGAGPADVAPIARRIGDAATRANRLIDDILDVAGIRAGAGTQARDDALDLGALAVAVVETFRLLHPTRRFNVASTGDVVGSWNGSRLTQIVTNLLDNALKHGAQATPIDVTVRGEGAAATIVVANAGPVIPVELHDAIFEPMRQGPTPARSKGVGLGLFIVREIARAHGGDVTVTSTVAGGTAFTVRLPKGGTVDAPATPRG